MKRFRIADPRALSVAAVLFSGAVLLVAVGAPGRAHSQTPPAGDVLINESFGNAATSQVLASTQVGVGAGDVFEGEYRIRLDNNNAPGGIGIRVPATHTDVSIEVDVRVLGAVETRVYIDCRQIDAGQSYRLGISPSRGLVTLDFAGRQASTQLVAPTASPPSGGVTRRTGCG